MKSKKEFKQNSIPDYSSLFEGVKDDKNIGFKLVIKFLKSNIVSLALSTLIFLVKHTPVWMLPIITANVIDIATYPEIYGLGDLVINGVILFILVLQNLYTHVLYTNYTSRFLRDVGAGLRNSLVKKLQQLSITYHNELKTGALQSKFLRDVEAIEQLFRQILFTLVPSIITMIITIAITVQKSLIVTAFFAVIVPINVFVITAFNKKMSKTNSEFRTESENVTTKITTMLEMISVTKSHGLEDEEIEKMESGLTHMKHSALRVDHVMAQFGSLSWVMGTLMNSICLLFTGYMAYIGKLSVGDVVLFQSFFGTISGQLQTLLNIYPEFSKGSDSLKSVSEIMLSENIENNKDKINIRFLHGMVEFKNVSYHYPNNTKSVIKNLTFTANPGECIAFVGASGSGKSTIMNMIIGFLTATDGEVVIDGKPIDILNLQKYRQFISVVPQNSILFSGTIRENIVYGMKKYSESQLQTVLELANIKEFTDKLPDGIETVIEEHGANLSGGQKQRIAIARALMRDPKMIILDEATSALDNISEFHVQKAMAHLIKGRTTFIVAHRLSTIRDADRIIVMENGECVESGTYEELMDKKGKFFELKTLNEMTQKSGE